MKKVILLIFVSILLLVAFTACDKECKHEEWTEATCQSAKTCTECGAKEGTALAHQSTPATCTTPQQCSVCGFTSEYWQAALGHDWAEADCLRGTAKTCKRCGLTEGDVPDHDWSAPTCTADSKCGVCGLTKQNSALGHDYVDVAQVDPTCTTNGYTAGVKCSRCGDVQSGVTSIPAIEHKGHEVTVPGTPAGCTTPGLTPGKKCDLCGTVTESQYTIDPKGHQRYTYDDEGNQLTDGYVGTTYPVNPATGLPYAACESDGTTTYTCQVCSEPIEIAEPKIDHKYADGATCTDVDAKCEYCEKSIEHEFLDPTCLTAAVCRICGEVDSDRPAYNHMIPGTTDSAFGPATCVAPSTCTLCGATEGNKLIHKLTFAPTIAGASYSCTDCGTRFTTLDESIYLDGSGYDNMVPVNNKFGGYETGIDSNGAPTQYPAIKTDADGNKYYSLIKAKDPELNDKGEAYAPQLQLWLPMQRNGFSGFNSSNSAVGFISFSINAYMDKNFAMTFVEGGGWGEEDVINNFFALTPATDVEVVDEESGNTSTKKVVQILALDNGTSPRLVLFEKDVTGITRTEDMFTGWLDVYIAIVLDDVSDTISLHYYIDGLYRGTVTAPLKTSGNGIKCVYFSGNTNTVGSGLMIDDIAFGYTANGCYEFDSEHEHVFNILADEVLPTCTNDGYRIYACDCGAIGTRSAIPTLGHLVHAESAVEATCTTDGHNAYSYCTREDCGVVLVQQVVYPAFGHDFDTSKNRPATCTTGGQVNQTCNTCGYRERYTVDALGHTYSLEANCYSLADCIVCGTPSTQPAGHVYAPATCTEPPTCMRAGCTHTEGEPLGHDMAAATCTKVSTCTRCDHTEGEKTAHTIEVKYVKSVITYVCTGCKASFQFAHGYTLNGSNTNNMVGANNATNGYTTSSGDLPKIVDGHYELIHTTNTTTQTQLWIPAADNSADFGFSSANRAVGVLSFKMNVYMTQNLDLKLVDGQSNSGNNRWQDGAVAGNLSISSVQNGRVTFTLSTLTGKNLINNHVIADVEVGDDNFTGWVDIVIGIVLDPDTDQITYHCYTNGEYVVSFSAELTTKTNSINCIYISGNTGDKDSGYMFDDFAFGYTANGTWIFDECHHEGTSVVTPATCTTDGYTTTTCTKCGHISISDIVPAFGHTEAAQPTCDDGYLCATCGEYYGEALGHTGGTATCENKPVCDRCGQEYGSSAHTVVEATCSEASYCSACGEVFGEKVSHKPVCTVNDQKVTYSCAYCEYSYTLDKVYYQDGETAIGGAVAVPEDPAYDYDPSGGSFKFEHITAPTGKNGKAWLWLPTNGTGVNDFEDFKTGAVGVLSFTVDVYSSINFQVHLIDSDNRSNTAFWNSYTMQGIFVVTPPDGSNVVTVKGWNGQVLKTITVSDSNKYTGELDVTIGIEMLSNNKITFHYYLGGEYITSVTDTFKIASGKVDGVTFLCESKVAGSGFTLDNISFGYAKPYGENLAPKKPE